MNVRRRHQQPGPHRHPPQPRRQALAPRPQPAADFILSAIHPRPPWVSVEARRHCGCAPSGWGRHVPPDGQLAHQVSGVIIPDASLPPILRGDPGHLVGGGLGSVGTEVSRWVIACSDRPALMSSADSRIRSSTPPAPMPTRSQGMSTSGADGLVEPNQCPATTIRRVP
jgi:hypothetical protein